MEIRDRVTRNVFVEASYSVQTGEAERIAVDWTAKGGEGGTSREYDHRNMERILSVFVLFSGVALTDSTCRR